MDTNLPPYLIAQVVTALPDLADLAWLALAGGRTNRAWRVGGTVVKVFDPAAASPLFPNDPGAEARALRHLGDSGLAPKLRASGQDWVAYSHLDGAAWQSGPAPVARLLHRLHRQAGTGFRLLGSGSTALRRQAEGMAALCGGALPPAPVVPDVAPLDTLVLIHADAVPGNLIVGPDGGVTLIDWQCPAQGDPCEDLALFLSPAMQWLYRGQVLSPPEIEAFLAAYPDPAVTGRYRRLAPLFSWRMAAHCLWKAENGASDYRAAYRHETDR